MSDPVLHTLRERFRETARVRLQEMVPLLDAIDADSMRRLARHFHAFAGLGATYGFPRVSELGDEGEASILPLVRCGEEPDGATLARWRVLCAEIERALENGEAMRVTSAAAPGPRRILAVEDDEMHAALLTHVLAGAGYDVTICRDVAECDAALEEFAPDLLLTDVQLADDMRGGYNLARRLRAVERFRDLPVIFVSADHAANSVDGDPLVAKPVDWTRLLSLIESRLC